MLSLRYFFSELFQRKKSPKKREMGYDELVSFAFLTQFFEPQHLEIGPLGDAFGDFFRGKLMFFKENKNNWMLSCQLICKMSVENVSEPLLMWRILLQNIDETVNIRLVTGRAKIRKNLGPARFETFFENILSF